MSEEEQYDNDFEDQENQEQNNDQEDNIQENEQQINEQDNNQQDNDKQNSADDQEQNNENNQESNDQQQEIEQSNQDYKKQNQFQQNDIQESVGSEEVADQNEIENLNLSSIDAVSVKVEKINKKDQQKRIQSAKKGGPSEQQKMVNQLLKEHKEKQKKLKQREDDIYVQEQVEKKQPKPARKPIVKQKLVMDKETKAQLEDPKKNNQEKAAIITKDLAKKLDKKDLKIQNPPGKIEIKKPSKENEPKTKVNKFEIRVGVGVPKKLEEDSEASKSKQLKQERQLFLEQKKKAKEKEAQQLKEQDELLKQRQQELIKQQQKAYDRENKALLEKSPKVDEYKQVQKAQMEEKVKAKEEDEKDKIKQENDILRALKRESQQLNQELKKQQQEIENLDQQINEWSRKDNVINIGGKYKSLKKIKLKPSNIVESDAVSLKSFQEYQEDFGEQTLAQKICTKIAQNGLQLKEAYALLDEDKDGVLTMKEVKNNMNRLNLNLSQGEMKQFIELLDSDSDGVLTEQEFIQALTKDLIVQYDYQKIMNGIEGVTNPIELEERKIHIKYLQKYIKQKIDDEKMIEYQQKPKYKQLIKKLKKIESLFDALKGTNNNKGELKIECEQLRNEIRIEYDKKNRVMRDLDEKKYMINKNIDQLTEKLCQLCQTVLKSKENVRQQALYTQKLELKLLAFQQIQDKFIREMEQKNQLEINVAKTQLELTQLQQVNQMQLKEIENKNQQDLHKIIMIQKLAKGKLWRRKLQRKVSNLKQCASILFQLFSRKFKSNHVIFLQQLELNLQNYYNQLEKNKQEQLKKKIEEKEVKRMEQFLSQQFVKKQKTQDDMYTEILPKIINLQKQIRMSKRKIPITNKVINVSFSNGQDVCQMCNTDLAEIICKKCVQPLYCEACFKISHKNYKKRNHQYYEITREHQNIQFQQTIEQQ